MTTHPDITWVDPFLPRLVNDPTFVPYEVRSAIDVGCGKGTIGAALRNTRRMDRLVGLDIHAPYLDHCFAYSPYNQLDQHDLSSGYLPYRTAEFDLALCCEVIEHLPHREALNILNELQRISRHVVVTTPSRFFAQDALDGNPHQVHQCLVSRRELRRAGYTVRGIGHLRYPFRHRTTAIESWRLGTLIPSMHPTIAAFWDDGSFL